MLSRERLTAALRHYSHRFGPVIAIAAAIPATVYLASSLMLDRSWPEATDRRPGAVRAEGGPGGSPESAAVAHLATPDFVKGIYVTAATVADARRFNNLVALAERTEINTLVIDVKNDRGDLAFAPRTESLKPQAEAKPSFKDFDASLADLHRKGFYLVARIFVFQDPALVVRRPELAVQRVGGGVWRDRRGTPWLDPAASEVWKYNAAVAKEVFNRGFDEVQFDYIRFPSDGDLSTIRYPVYDGKTSKYEVMGRFFAYLDAELRVKGGIKTSVDLFGLTMWQHDYDLGIGQRLREAIPHFDYISPMVYPSHYATGFQGFANPALFPYEVVHDNMVKARPLFEEMRAKAAGGQSAAASARPWIQDFHLGATYTPDMVRVQMKAVAEGGGSGWLLWNAKNVYSESALAPREKTALK